LFPPISALVCASSAWRVQHAKLVVDNRAFTNSSFRLTISNSVSNAFRSCGSDHASVVSLSRSHSGRSWLLPLLAICIFNYLSF
jgi:hypothetical protein